MSLTITGVVKQIFAAETKGTFTFRNMWITTEAGTQYPQTVEVQCSGQKLNLFDNLQPGREVTAHVNLRGKEYNGKVYHSFSAWKIDASTLVPDGAVPVAGEQSKDDLPF